MDTLLLIAFNLVFVPFLQETEALGRKRRQVPGIPSVLRLAHVRRTHWFRPFCVLAMLFSGAVLAASAKLAHAEGLFTALGVLLIQAILWTTVLWNIRKVRKAATPAHARAEQFPHGPRPLSSITVY
jgi:uncharacterized membrane protein